MEHMHEMHDAQYHRQRATCKDTFRVWLTLESQLFVPKQLFDFTGQGLQTAQLLYVMPGPANAGVYAKYATSCWFQLAQHATIEYSVI